MSPDAFEKWKAALRVQWEASIVAFQPWPARASEFEPPPADGEPSSRPAVVTDPPPCAGHNVARAPIVVGSGGGGGEIGYARGGNGGSGGGSSSVSGGAGGCGNTQARVPIQIYAGIAEQGWAAFRMGMEDLRLYRERAEAFRERMAKTDGDAR